MFETMSIESLQCYWWVIISILGSLLVLLMFVQGGLTMIYTIGKTEAERKMVVNSLGRKWAFTFATLVIFGGAFIASFPLYYPTGFRGACWVWMAIVFAFIIQVVAYEFRNKTKNFQGHKTYEWSLIITGFLGTVLIGVVVATFFTGSDFTVNRSAMTNLLDPAISQWHHPAHGLEALLNWRNAALGLAVFFLTRVLGTLYFMNTISDEQILARLKKQLLINIVPFLVFFLVFLFGILTIPGFAVRPYDGSIYGESNKYYHNLVQMPLVLMALSAGVVFVLLGVTLPLTNMAKNARSGIWYAGAGAFLAVFSLFCLVGFNNTAYYPSVADLQSSLTIHNSSSSHHTLTVMSYVSLLVPIVVACVGYAVKWRNSEMAK